MRKPEEIAKRYKNFIVAATEEEVVIIIKQIQIEAIEETVRRCADEIESYVDRKYVLLIADQLKKELE